MHEADWDLFTDLCKQLHAAVRRVEDLESRCTKLERQLRDRDPEAQVYAERPVLRVVEPEGQPRCPNCERHHDPQLPCAPVDEAWVTFADDVTGVPA